MCQLQLSIDRSWIVHFVSRKSVGECCLASLKRASTGYARHPLPLSRGANSKGREVIFTHFYSFAFSMWGSSLETSGASPSSLVQRKAFKRGKQGTVISDGSTPFWGNIFPWRPRCQHQRLEVLPELLNSKRQLALRRPAMATMEILYPRAACFLGERGTSVRQRK